VLRVGQVTQLTYKQLPLAYDMIRPYLATLINPVDVHNTIPRFFATVNSVTMNVSSAAHYLQPFTNPYDIPQEFVSILFYTMTGLGILIGPLLKRPQQAVESRRLEGKVKVCYTM